MTIVQLVIQGPVEDKDCGPLWVSDFSSNVDGKLHTESWMCAYGIPLEDVVAAVSKRMLKGLVAESEIWKSSNANPVCWNNR